MLEESVDTKIHEPPHPNTQNFDCGDPAFIEVLKRTAELDVPVIIDSYSPWDDAQPSKLLNAILSSPETELCLAHVGVCDLWILVSMDSSSSELQSA